MSEQNSGTSSPQGAVGGDVCRIRWFNRLAAWLYPHISDPLITLALPVWNAEAEADLRDLWDEEESYREAEMNAAYDAGLEAGRDER